MTVTLQNVAERAGVSKITVSRVITGSGTVRGETAARVQAAIDELGYIPNHLARSLRSRQSMTLALLLPDITNPYWTTVARGVEDEARQQGFGVFLCNTDEDPEKEARYIDLAIQRRVDGIILGPTPESHQALHRLTSQKVAFVLVDRAVEGVRADSVRGDSYGGSFALTEHLLRTGKERIAFVGGPISTSTGLDRLHGYRAALAVDGHAIDTDLIKIGGYSQQSGYLLAKELMELPKSPDAMITGNNQITLGSLLALTALGKSVPDDIALVSFDDIPAMNCLSPLLTAAVQPAYRIGRLGAERLLQRISGDVGDVQDYVLPVRLIIRRSCGCPSTERARDEFYFGNEAILTEA